MAKKSAAPPPPPPAELPPELLATLPPPPPAALSPEPFEPPAVSEEERAAIQRAADALEALSVAQAEIDRLQKELAAAQAARPARGSQHQPRRNWAFELPNGSRRIVSGVTEREAREKLGKEAASAKFKGCPQ